MNEVRRYVAALVEAGREVSDATLAADPGAAHAHDQALAALRELLREAGCDLRCPHLVEAVAVGAEVGTGIFADALGVRRDDGAEAYRLRVVAGLAAAAAEVRDGAVGSRGGPVPPTPCAAPGGGEP